MKLKKIFIILLILSPFFWWQFFVSPKKIISEYRQIPTYIKNKVGSIFKNTQYIDEFRWNNLTKDNRPISAKVFYNKSHLLVSESIIYLNNLNPRFYFQSGSGQFDSPPQIEPIAIFLLPFSFMGLFKLIQKKNFKVLLFGLFSVLLGYLTGHSSFYFLFPSALFYLYTSAYQISLFKNKQQYLIIILLSVYTLFLFLRVFFITNI